MKFGPDLNGFRRKPSIGETYSKNTVGRQHPCYFRKNRGGLVEVFDRCRADHGIQRGIVLHIRGQYDVRTHAFCQRAHTIAKRFALIGEGDLGAFARERFGNTRRNGSIACDADDQRVRQLRDDLPTTSGIGRRQRHSAADRRR